MKINDMKVNVLGIGVTSSSSVELINGLRDKLTFQASKRMWIVTTPNPEQVVQASKDDVFRSILNDSQVSVTDGVGLVWATRWLVGQKVERITGKELAEELVRVCKKRGLRVMLVGGGKGVARAAAEVVGRDSKFEVSHCDPKFEILGESGARDISAETEQERAGVLKRVKQFRPKLVLVAYGAPWQEKWLWENRQELSKAGVSVGLVVGGAFDVWVGKLRSAPGFVRQLGIEWLWRLVQEPWRWKRQLKLLQFVGMVVKEKLKSA